MRNTPWFHQRRSESAPPMERSKDPPTISQQQQDDIVARISRPTESARYRKSLYWKLDGYMDKGFHSWSKMDLFTDSKRCMWTPDGAIKKSCKIRPINRVLPPVVKKNRDTLNVAYDCPLNSDRDGNGRPCLNRSVTSLDDGRSVSSSQGPRCESRSKSTTHSRQSMNRPCTTSMQNGRSLISICEAGKSYNFGCLRSGGAGYQSLAIPRLNQQTTSFSSHLVGK